MLLPFLPSPPSYVKIYLSTSSQILNRGKIKLLLIKMKTAAILTAMAGSAAAFAPTSSVRSSTSLSEFANGLVGGEGPEPMPFRGGEKTSKNFDPAGFSEVSLQYNTYEDKEYTLCMICISFIYYILTWYHFSYTFCTKQRAPEWINWFREAELKHGRQAMLATVGLVVPEFVRIPGEQFSFEAIPNVINAHDALIDTSMKQILLWISLWEAMTFGALSNMGEFDRQPGDWSFDPLGLKPSDPEELKKMQLKELKNGRLVSTQDNE